MNLQTILQSLSSNWGMTIRGDRAFIRCPFHRKNGKLERTPSFCINLSSRKGGSGQGHCFGCGVNKSWKEIAKALKISGNIDFDLTSSHSRTKTRKSWTTVFIDWDPAKKWRGISGKLLAYLKAKAFTSGGVDWVRIPCWQNKEQIGYVDCRVNRAKGQQGYLNSEGPWVASALFGFDLAKKLGRKAVVIVEGPRDALNLLQHKVPAVAILGTSNIKKQKIELLLANWEYVICGFDPDDAGDVATAKLKQLVGIRAKIKYLEFEEGCDAADLSKSEIDEIKTMIRRFTTGRT